MRVISVITKGSLIERLLKHVRGKAAEDGKDPFDARAPPAAMVGAGSEAHQVRAESTARGGRFNSRVGEERGSGPKRGMARRKRRG